MNNIKSLIGFCAAFGALLLSGCGGGGTTDSENYLARDYRRAEEVLTWNSDFPLAAFTTTSQEVIVNNVRYHPAGDGSWSYLSSRGGGPAPFQVLTTKYIILASGNKELALGGTNPSSPTESEATINRIKVSSLTSAALSTKYRFVWTMDARDGKLLIWALEQTRGGFMSKLLIIRR